MDQDQNQDTDDIECWKDDPDKEAYYDYYHDTMCTEPEKIIDNY